MNKNIFLMMSPSTKKRSVSSERITTSPEAPTINTPPSPFVSTDYFDDKLQYMFDLFDQIFEEQHNRLGKSKDN